jgi:ferredoxin
MKVWADEDRCQGHGLCHMVAPDVFDLKEEDGHVLVRTPQVPPELEEDAVRGVEGCPEMALNSEG